MTNKHLRMFEFNVLLLIPENVEGRKMNTASFPLLASFLPDALQPAHLIQPFSERFFTVKAAAKIAENIEIITCFKLRLHQLLHGDNSAVGVVAILVKIVTFKLGRRRQYDVGESTGRRPLIIDGDDGFQLTPSLNNAINLLVTMERVGPGKNTHLQRR